MKKTAFLALLLVLPPALFAAGKKVDIEAEKKALVQAEADFEAARAQKGMEGWLSFFSEDTANFNSGKPITFSKAEMREQLTKTWNPDAILKWQPVKVDVAASGDLAYTVGSWQLTGKNRKGEPISMTGKYMTVWKKQADGAWKVVADIGNAD
jgi:ketosteroid isomerase-like protein